MDFETKFGYELVKNLWNYIKEHLKGFKVESRFLQFSAFLYIVGLVILTRSSLNVKITDSCNQLCKHVFSFFPEKAGKLQPVAASAIVDFIYVNILAYIACFFSVVIVKCSSGINWLGFLYAGGAYEEREGRFYLRQKYLVQREFFGLFENKIGYIWTIIVIFYGVLFYKDWIYEPMEQADSVLVYLLIWLRLLGEYYSGRTYQEVQQCFFVKKKVQKRVIHNLANDIMKTSIKQFQLFSFPMKYGIRYPQKTFAENYRTFYEALLNGESIYVEDIFYHDWERAFFIPANKALLEYRKIVILAGSSLDVQDIEQWLKNGFEKLNGCDETWKIRIWDGSDESSEIIIVPFEIIPEYVCRSRIIHKNDRGIFCVVMEPSAMMAQLQFYLEQYVQFLGEMREMPFYCFADRYMIGLRDYLSHVFQCRIEHIEINTDRSGQVYLCTSETGENEEVKKYWGVLLGGCGCGSVYFHELSKAGFENIEYVSRNTIPVKDFCCLLKNKMAVTCSSQEEQQQLEESFRHARFHRGIWGISREEDKCILVTDENCHLYDLIWNLATRGIRNCYLFLLSGDYLLFDFMVQNMHRLLQVRNAVPVLFPVYQDSDRNRFLKIFRRWKLYGEFDRRELEKICPNHAGRGNMELCFALNRETKVLFHGRPFRFREGKIEIRPAFFEYQSELWKEVFYVDEQTNRRSFGCLFACHLRQNQRREQYLVKDGCYYQIREIRDGVWTDNHGVSRECKEVWLLKSSGFMQHMGLYYQNRQYSLRILEHKPAGDRKDGFAIFRCTADIKVITGDWFLEHFNAAGNPRIISVHDSVPIRYYWDKPVLLICLQGESIEFWNCMKEILVRMIRTLYPTHYPYLDFLPVENIEGYTAGMYVIEDCVDDLGMLESFEKNWSRIIKLCSNLYVSGEIWINRNGTSDFSKCITH